MQTNKKMFVHAKPSEADSNNVQRMVDYKGSPKFL